MSEEVLRTEHISKSFGRVTALRNASIRLAKGEVSGFSATMAPESPRF